MVSGKFNTTPLSRAQVLWPKTKLVALLLGATIAFWLISEYFIGKKTDFEDAAAFGAQTTSVYANVGGYPIHCIDSRDSAACLAGSKVRKAERSVLWLGNSQVHSVNQLQQGETNAAPILFDALKRQGLDLLTFSQPNAGLQEHYVLFEYLRRQLPLRILVLSVVFDDLREEGLRKGIAFLARSKATATALLVTGIGRRLVSAARVVPKDQDTAGIAQTIQERVERSLNLWLKNHSSLWKTRPELRGQLFNDLYLLRNSLFGIKATSKRKMIPGRYRDNLAALTAILAVAERNNIGVVLYVAPFRAGIEHPYVETEYAQFKLNVEVLAKRFGAVYANLEALVPEELWGHKPSTDMSGDVELDFMHFQAGGHKLLAKRLEGLVIEALATRENAQ